jgi:hypothetical protein
MAFGKAVGGKLSVATFGFDKERILEIVSQDKTKEWPLVRFTGVATGLRKYKKPDKMVKPGESAEGYGLSGDFEGESIDGQIESGNVLYLSAGAHAMVEAALSMSEDVLGVRIAFDVYAKYDKDAATFYVYVTRDVLNEGGQSVAAIKEAIKDVPALGSDSAVKKLK